MTLKDEEWNHPDLGSGKILLLYTIIMMMVTKLVLMMIMMIMMKNQQNNIPSLKLTATALKIG